MTETTSAEFTRLLEYLRAARGFDFTGYKISSLMRRMQKRMSSVGCQSYAEYTDYLEVHPDEFSPLFNTVLINVTSFFRDPEAWKYVAEQIVPKILEDKGPTGMIRAWSAGCASGQEAYTVAMLLAEALGEEAFKRRVKIYATDADDEALAEARLASYDDRQVEDMHPELLTRYFEATNGRHVFRTDLRRSLIFGRHDLVQDAAISRIDLLVCRNTLMYFNVETQAKILARFHFALAPTGYLLLGKAETLLAHGNSFRPVDLKRRVFQRAPHANSRERLLAIAPAASEGAAGSRLLKLRQAAFDRGLIAEMVVDRKGHLILTNQRARRLFGLAASDLGRLLQDLEVSYRPVDLRSGLDEAYANQSQVRVGAIAWTGGPGELLKLELQILPLADEDGALLGATILFIDLTQAEALKQELERANQELETAYEELQSTNEELETTNEELQSTVEELETTNEELHSTNEELETTNEELQSTNEELETMNEELQSTNEELQTINEELRERTQELNEVNAFLETILTSMGVAVVVLDRNLTVRVWNAQSVDMWGVRSDEAEGEAILGLDLGVPVDRLAGPLRDVLRDGGTRVEVVLDAINRRGRAIACRVVALPLSVDGRDVSGAILLMEELSQQAAS
jgi:two-component system CheB/CheR fusion protein